MNTMINPGKEYFAGGNVNRIFRRRTLSFVALLCGVAMSLPAQANGANETSVSISSGTYRTPVVELYTSEGCSSCPRADNWISKLGTVIDDDFNAVPLAFHVDYWNYLGWEDPFSKAAFTDRQRELGAINKQRSIYTPEFLVSGEETRGTTAVVKAIEKANAEESEVDINMTLTVVDDGAIRASLTVDSKLADGVLYVALYESNIVREIGGGENSGRTLTHDFVVRHWDSVANIKEGKTERTHNLELGQDWQRENLGVAAIVLDRRNGKTLQATRVGLESLFANDKLAAVN